LERYQASSTRTTTTTADGGYQTEEMEKLVMPNRVCRVALVTLNS
jgi:hypothetical protein